MHLVRFKKSIQGFKKDGVYIFDNYNIKQIPFNLYESIPYKAIQPFTTQKTLLLVRSGGIGDIIAMSILQHVAPNVVFLTQKKYAPYLNLWQKPPRIKHFAEPLFKAKSLDDLNRQLELVGRLNGEDAIELGSKDNWYDIFAKAATCLPIHRPQLTKPNNPTIPGCLIVSKSGVINRTANKQDIDIAARKYFSIVIHADEQNWTTQKYIEALKSFAYVITTDTSALHLREGFGLPALGLYGAFNKESRVSGYEHTTSIQINSGCTPCHSNSKLPCQYNQGTYFAPCLSNMTEQIEQELYKTFESI